VDIFVIVGAGLAGAKAAEALRTQGFVGVVVLVGEETHLPYERPPLSKDFLAGNAEQEGFTVHERRWYEDKDIDLRLGTTVTAVDRTAHQLELSDGSRLDYTKLLLATGSSPRTIEGADPAKVHYLRTVDDAIRLRAELKNEARVVVIGAGWIGLEVTAAARQAGAEVTVLEYAELPLLRVLGPEVANVFKALHEEHGVDMRFNARVTAITENAVHLADGTVVEANAIVVAVGAAPNTALAEAAGLDVDNGILVDASLRTSDPDIYAVGDVANEEHPILGQRVRVEHWANALNQPATAAKAMQGEPVEYDELPYFYTDQYDLGMEYIGHADPGAYDRVVFRGDVATREFIAFWLQDNKIKAGMNVNVWDVVDPVKALIKSGRTVDPAKLANPDVPLDEV
jgi:3-phenylpropionate/trans-cinnamate dioxygenase ferredoxin reductase subunit